MCGIAGVMTADGSLPSVAILDAMTEALAHRGPDGKGRFLAPGLGLAQTRLAIIDLKTGDQPFFGPDDTLLVANGEIYNYIELKQSFPNRPFITRSDCEVPLFTFARDRAHFAESLRGMYAIALAEPRRRTLYLARDPFGIKPLYHAATQAGFVFASEAQALLKTGLIPRKVRRQTAAELLQLQFTTGRETIFEGIHRLGPAETLVLQDGEIVERKRQRPFPHGQELALAEAEAVKRLDTALMDSVMVHQRADVPFGMFLSGGVDSSVLAVCMARWNERPVRAFTAGFPGTEARDERAHAKRVARAVGAEHIEVEVTAKDFWTYLPAVAAALDDPVADYAALPTYMLGKEAAKELKVVLTGEGGDELFGGYGRYRDAMRSRFLGGRPMRRSGFMDGLGVLRDSSRAWRHGIALGERRLARAGNLTRLQQAQALDCADWLPNDLLLKVDRCLMAHGLEGRTPFLDPAVANLAFHLPDGLKIANGHGKYLLRRWLEYALPLAEPFTAKRGFTVPVAQWLGPEARKLAPLIARNAGIAEICHSGKVAELFHAFGAKGGKREGTACWILLFYALWHRVHVEAKAPVGDVFAMLEAA